MDNLDRLTRLPNKFPLFGGDEYHAKPELDSATASSLMKLFLSEDWTKFQEFIDDIHDSSAQTPEVYIQDLERVKFDAGVRHTVQMIKYLKQEAEEAVNYYAQTNGRGAETPGA